MNKDTISHIDRIMRELEMARHSLSVARVILVRGDKGYDEVLGNSIRAAQGATREARRLTAGL